MKKTQGRFQPWCAVQVPPITPAPLQPVSPVRTISAELGVLARTDCLIGDHSL